MDEFGNIVGESYESDPSPDEESEPINHDLDETPPRSIDSNGWPILVHNRPGFGRYIPESTASQDGQSSGRQQNSFPIVSQQSYSLNYPLYVDNSVYSVVDNTRTATFHPMNSAEINNSNTVQGGNVGNIAVQCIGTGVSNRGPGIDDYSTSNARNIAQMSIVLDESYTSHASNEPQVSPSGSSEASVSQGTNLYHCRIQDQNPLGALAIAQMQVKMALAGTANPVKYKTRAQDN